MFQRHFLKAGEDLQNALGILPKIPSQNLKNCTHTLLEDQMLEKGK